MLGEKIKDLKLVRRKIPYVGVKEAVMPFNMFPEVDPVLGPEMRSTGEVLGMAPSFGLAYFKAEEAAQPPLPLQGTVLISVTDKEKTEILATARSFQSLGFRIVATKGTQAYLAANGVAAEAINKMHEGRPHIVDAMTNGKIQLIVNTPIGKRGSQDDSYIRKAAVKHKIPYLTTTAAARAAVQGIAESRVGRAKVKSLQEYHRQIM
jgi:carbamoyl-phosphate synthase large subunit